MRTYTEKIHAERVLKMLGEKDPCLCCPAQRRFKTGTPFIFDSYSIIKGRFVGVCDVCRDFVGIPYVCPCQYLGGKEAIKRTWIALEAKGYLE